MASSDVSVQWAGEQGGGASCFRRNFLRVKLVSKNRMTGGTGGIGKMQGPCLRPMPLVTVLAWNTQCGAAELVFLTLHFLIWKR